MAAQKLAVLLFAIALNCSMAMGRKDSVSWNSPDLQQLFVDLDSDRQQDFTQFVVFMKEYNRTYTNLHEARQKFAIFQQSLATAKEIQRQELGTARFGVTQFSDMTLEEFQQKYTGHKASEKPKSKSKSVPPSDFKLQPLVLNGTLALKRGAFDGDWQSSYCDVGKCCPIKNQHHCGSCYAFATVAVIESSHAQYSHELLCLSEQEIVDCYSKGCDGGNFRHSTNVVRQMGGLALEQDYPYNAVQGRCHGPTGRRVNVGPDLRMAGDEAVFYNAMQYSPVYVGIAGHALKYYKHGISKTQRNNERLSHAVVLVGVGSEGGQQYWLVRNSWGTAWGENGYFRLAFGEDVLGIADEDGYRV